MFAPVSRGWSWIDRRASLEKRLKAWIHHWRFDKNLLSWLEFGMLCIRHGLENNLFYFSFKKNDLLHDGNILCIVNLFLKRSWCDQIRSDFFHVPEGRKSINLISRTDSIDNNMGIDVAFDQILNSALNTCMCFNPTNKNITEYVCF